METISIDWSVVPENVFTLTSRLEQLKQELAAIPRNGHYHKAMYEWLVKVYGERERLKKEISAILDELHTDEAALVIFLSCYAVKLDSLKDQLYEEHENQSVEGAFFSDTVENLIKLLEFEYREVDLNVNNLYIRVFQTDGLNRRTKLRIEGIIKMIKRKNL